MKKILIILLMLFTVSSCSKVIEEEITEFQKKYNVDSTLVQEISYEEFLEFSNEKTGIIFIGDETDNSKDLAEIFCEVLCECDVNKAYFLDKELLDEKDLIKVLDIKEIKYPVIVAYKQGEVVEYYDKDTKTTNLKKHIDDLVHTAYPNICTEVC